MFKIPIRFTTLVIRPEQTGAFPIKWFGILFVCVFRSRSGCVPPSAVEPVRRRVAIQLDVAAQFGGRPRPDLAEPDAALFRAHAQDRMQPETQAAHLHSPRASVSGGETPPSLQEVLQR